MIQLAAILAAACLQIPETSEDTESWRALPLPALCHEPAAIARLQVLEYGRHLVEPGDDLGERSPSSAPHLPIPVLLGLLSDETARRGLSVEFQPTAPPLLARGSAAELDALTEVLVDLDRAGRALDVRVEAWLTEGSGPASAFPGPADLDQALARTTAESAPWAEARLRSGAGVVLGTREQRSFLLSYSIELAADSGVAEPLLGTAILGTTVHLIATRTAGGTRVAVEGFLDVAELLALESFDTDTYDVGLLQQPRVGALQVAFSGTVDSGGLLAVSYAGAPLGLPDRTLWLRLACTPDDETFGAWRGLDLALLERRIIDLPMPHPGAGLSGVELPSLPRVLCESLPASALAQAFSRGSARGAALRPVWAPGYLLAPSAGVGWAEVQALVDAAHGARAPSAELLLEQGPLRVRLPLAEGLPMRVLVGIETTVLADYDAEVAQEIWLPRVVVEPVFDGLLVQGHLREGTLRAAAWRSHSGPGSTLERDETRIGRFQLQQRGLQAARCELPSGAPPAPVLRPDAGAGALSGTLVAR